MRIVMMGTGTFAGPAFRKLIEAGERVVGLVTQPEREGVKPRGSSRLVGEGLAGVARAAGIPVLQPPSINVPEAIGELRSLEPDLLVVAAYGQILKPAVIEVPKLGAINIHASLLPKYRGASPIAHAILNGETETGVTIIRISPGLDAGRMLLQEAMAILPDETTGELEIRLAELGARMGFDVVQRLKVGPVDGEIQDAALVTKAPKLAKEQGAIDWKQPAEAIVRHVRAMQPWPTAYTFAHRPGKAPVRIALNLVRAAGEFAVNAKPGSWLVDSPAGSLYVACGQQSVLSVLALQPAGKSRLLAADYLRGHPLVSECRFDAG